MVVSDGPPDEGGDGARAGDATGSDRGGSGRGGSGRGSSDRAGTRTGAGLSDAALEEELAELEQDPSTYETRDQEEIDRYERLLAERRRRRDRDAREEAASAGRLARAKRWLLRRLGLR